MFPPGQNLSSYRPRSRGRISSLHHDVIFRNHLAPQLGLAGEELGGVRRRAAHGIEPQAAQLVLDVGLLQNFSDIGVDLVGERRRQAGQVLKDDRVKVDEGVQIGMALYYISRNRPIPKDLLAELEEHRLTAFLPTALKLG